MTRIGVTGHQNLGVKTRRLVTAAIGSAISAYPEDELIGYTSLAEGADQLFAFVVLAAGGQVHAVVPSGEYETSFQSARALENYRALVTLAEDVEQLPHDAPGEEAYFDGGRTVVDRADVLLAVWDGAAAAGRGGTGDVVNYARSRGVAVQVIWPAGARRG